MLLLPVTYVLLQPWLCPFGLGSASFVTSECGSALRCGSFFHVLSLVVSALLLAVLFVTLCRSTFALPSLTAWVSARARVLISKGILV